MLEPLLRRSCKPCGPLVDVQRRERVPCAECACFLGEQSAPSKLQWSFNCALPRCTSLVGDVVVSFVSSH